MKGDCVQLPITGNVRVHHWTPGSFPSTTQDQPPRRQLPRHGGKRNNGTDYGTVTDRILAWLTAHPEQTLAEVTAGIGDNSKLANATLRRLHFSERVKRTGFKGAFRYSVKENHENR